MSMRHAFLGALLVVLVFLACNRESTSTEIVGPEEPPPEEADRGTLSLANLTLPFKGTTNAGPVAFWITQTGVSARNGLFEIANSTNQFSALEGVTNGSGAGVSGTNKGTGPAGLFVTSGSNPSPALDVRTIASGPAGRFQITNGGSNAPTLDVLTIGEGTAVNVLAQGGGNAGLFRISNSNAFAFALQATTNGQLQAIAGVNSGAGGAGLFQITATSNNKPAVEMSTRGTGTVLDVDHGGSTGSLAEFQVNGANRIRFTRDGKGIFNGGTQTGGADVAEAFEVEGPVRDYEPGDVLLISTRSDRRVERSNEPYSTRIAGVVATKPGLLLTERDIDANLDDTVPVGIVGVIPTKVSAENGAIRRGDLLVTARTAGHAMRGRARSRMFGATIGRALAEFRGPGSGVIPVLVNVK